MMPSVSRAQRKKMFVLFKEGKITAEQLKDFRVIKKPKKGKK